MSPTEIKKIEFTDPEEKILFEGKYYYLCPAEQLEKLLSDNLGLKSTNAELSGEIATLKEVVLSIIGLFGLLDEKTGTIKASIQSGEESYFKHILKALNKIIMMVTMAQISKSSEKELADTFAFIKKVIPLINKYGNQPGAQPGEPTKQLPGTGK